MPNAPDRKLVCFIPFDWTDSQDVKPIYRRRTNMGDRDYFAGISQNGSPHLFDLSLNEVSYMSIAKAQDNFAGFLLRREGALSVPGTFWLAGLHQGQKPDLVADHVMDFVMLDHGNCVFSSIEHGHKELSLEAFFRVHQDKSLCDILAGVERLPPLDQEWADKSYVQDKLNIQLIPGFGHGKHGPLVLCLFAHFRGDMRALPFPGPHKTISHQIWRRAMIMKSNGQRYMVDGLDEGHAADQIWLYNTGKLILAKYLWESSGSSPQRKIQLSETTVQLP